MYEKLLGFIWGNSNTELLFVIKLFGVWLMLSFDTWISALLSG